MSKLPGNKLSNQQWRVVVSLKNGVTLHQEIDNGARSYFFSDGRKRPHPATIHKLLRGEWLRVVDDGLFGDGQTLILT